MFRIAALVAASLLWLAATLNAQITFPNSGPAAAQPAFLRGVVLLHNFEYDEAIAAFREAERIAPTFALAYWGEALCYGQPLWYNENLAKGREALARLAPTPTVRAAAAPTPRERGYLDAVEQLFGTSAVSSVGAAKATGVAAGAAAAGSSDRSARQRAYADRMALLHREFPADDEAALFYALALLGTIPDGARRPEISLQAGRIASAVLTRNPAHPGAAHYVLHACDDGVHNRLGLRAARLYAKMVPASSHARHMPSHVFLPLGLWDEASAADEASWAASVAWVTQTGRTLAQQDFHSLSWLHYEYLQQGRFVQARALMEPVQRALNEPGASTSSADPQSHLQPQSEQSQSEQPQQPQSQQSQPGAQPQHHAHGSEIGRGYGPTALKNELASMRARDVVESGDWSRMQGQGTFDNVDELFALGLSAIKLGDLPRGDAAVEQLQNASRVLRDRDQRDLTALMAAQLTGLLQIARGDPAPGLATLAKTADAEARRPPPIARPYPVKPAAELYAEALLTAGQPKLAVPQFQRALTRTPRRTASLRGLAQAARAAGLPTIANRAAHDLQDVLKHAD